MSIGCPEPSTMRTQARSDCGHCSNGPKAVADQSSARILAPISPPPANTDSINCVLMRSMSESLDSAFGTSGVFNPILSLVMDTRLLEAAANECRASQRASTKACNRVWRTVSEGQKPERAQTAELVACR